MADLTLRIEWSRHEGTESVRLTLKQGGVAEDEFSSPLNPSFGQRSAQALEWFRSRSFMDPDARTLGDPAASAAALAGLGEELFRALFLSVRAKRIWRRAAEDLAKLRVEIITAHADDAAPLPWELLREPGAAAPVATLAKSFVRGASLPPEAPLFDPDSTPVLRVLCAILKPMRPAELRFESQVRRLVRRLGLRERSRLRVDVLRPPTYGRLSSALVEAEALGERYHALHLDGVGVYADLGSGSDAAEPYSDAARTRDHDLSSGANGFIVFDHAHGSERMRLVDAAALAELLGESRTPLLTLTNCCRPTDGAEIPAEYGLDPQRAFESLACDLTEMGLSVVSAPRADDAEAQERFFLDLYERLAIGDSLGEAAAAARRAAARRTKEGPSLISVYEPTPAMLISPPRGAAPERKASATDLLDPALPGGQDSTWTPRDGEVLEVERALDSAPALLLHGPTGAGKSWLAAEYARWLVESGGLDGPVIYSSFQVHGSLASLLDQLASVFFEALGRNGFEWESLSFDERFDTALLVLAQIPVLWVWDSFDLVDGDPEADREPWDDERRQELIEFLETCVDSQARILLTSRDPAAWLGDSIRRHAVRPWDAAEQARLVSRILAAERRRMPVEDWAPAMRLAAGNPLATRLIVTEGLLEGPADGRAVKQLVGRVRDASAQSKPTEGAVEYVLAGSFSDAEQDCLALLHLFRGTLDVGILGLMADPDESWGVSDLLSSRAFQRIWVNPESSLLGRATRLGLLSRLGEGTYRIETASTGPLRRLFERRYKSGGLNVGVLAKGRLAAVGSDRGREDALRSIAAEAPRKQPGRYETEPTPRGASAAQRAERAFVEAVSRFCDQDPPRLIDEHDAAPEIQPLPRLESNEPNLHQACRLARRRGWWHALLGAVRGLGALYETSGRVSVWQELVDSLASDCVDGATLGPLSSREALWREVTDQRVRLANKRRELGRALDLQRLIVDWDREQTSSFLPKKGDELEPGERFKLARLAESLNRLGSVARRDAKPQPDIEAEAVRLCEQLGELETVADWTYELGGSYTEIRGIRDLVKAERWLRRGLDMTPDGHSGRGRFLAALGQVAWERFRHARQSERPEAELIRHLMDARNYYERAIEHDPPDDHAALATHNLHYGHVSYSLGDIDRALPHYRESIRHDQLQGNIFGAAKTRFNLAIALRDVGRLGEARKYAISAFGELRSIEGPISEDLLDRARRLVTGIEDRIEDKRKKRQVRAPQASGW